MYINLGGNMDDYSDFSRYFVRASVYPGEQVSDWYKFLSTLSFSTFRGATSLDNFG